MRSGISSLIVVGIACSAALYAITSYSPASSSLYTVLSADDMEFIKYVAKFGKQYLTKEEFDLRSSIFKKNL